MAKQIKKEITEFTVNVRVSGDLSINVPAESLDAAIEFARAQSFESIVGDSFENLDLGTEVTGVFKNA